jgi:Xaa-Pro aminopeptidase
MNSVRLANVALPEFGEPRVEPVLSKEIYAARLQSALGRARKAGYEVLVVYADREHSANMAYLTGYDPRFEEALVILRARKTPALLVGNEGWGYAAASPVELRRILYQSFSLVSQPRDAIRPLEDILREEGIGPGSRVGVAGWKYFTPEETPHPEGRLEIPSYIVEILRSLTGDAARVENANAIFMNPADGLRVTHEVDQLAAFEYASCETSTAVRNVLFGLRPGMTEYEAVRLMRLSGMPLSCHLMFSSGPRASLGLPSPSSRRIERGDRLVTAVGVWGALNCRAGFVVDHVQQLPAEARDYVEELVAPYFSAIVAWYEALRIGATGGELYEAIRQNQARSFLGVKLNPGHHIHLDEWVSSPVGAGSKTELRSGMALQVDVIPEAPDPYFTTNIEDGVALADADLRRRFAEAHPEAWRRIQSRREFMQEQLGISLRPEVLPLSNIPSYLQPFLLRPGYAMVAERPKSG